MITNVLTKIFGSRNQRLLKTYGRNVERINALEPAIAALSDAVLRAKTDEFRKRVADGEALDDLLPEAFAVVREAGVRALKMRHFDVQLLGGMVLHAGKIAEMRTGEGKTLMSTLPAYLNAIAGKGVHIVTVNDYLAQRDADWMGKLYGFLGLTVGVNLSQLEAGNKREAYAADITYGTNNEFGFDYLRDNMAMHVEDRYQRALNFAIVDEVDSILIDEARTPLIISGQAEDRTELYHRMNEVAPLLAKQAVEDGPGDFWVDEKNHQVLMSEAGHAHAEEILVRVGLLPEGASLYEPTFINLVHHLYAALRAHHLFHRDQQYVVQNDEVIIVDEFTGRLMQGRRWSDGLHQAVEAKEKVPINVPSDHAAQVTFQNFYRIYGKLAGMSGTLLPNFRELRKVYRLWSTKVPTNKPNRRDNLPDQVFPTEEMKFDAVVKKVQEMLAAGRPILIGTRTVDASKRVSAKLTAVGVKHRVLNAEQNEGEAEVVSEAGQPGRVTVATNMAGRGTDIKLGDGVAENGGLHVIGTERHEAERIDRQLLGRSGRQGDPGSAQFMLSLEDQLLEGLGTKKQDELRALGRAGGNRNWNQYASLFPEAQRRVEKKHYKQRLDLKNYDKQRQELLQDLGADPYVD